MLLPWQTGRTMKLFKKDLFLILEVVENWISIVWEIWSFSICLIFNEKRKPKFPKDEK